MFGYPFRREVVGWLPALALVALASAWLRSGITFDWYPEWRVSGDTTSVFSVVLGLALDAAWWVVLFKLAVEALVDAAEGRSVDGGGTHASDAQAVHQGVFWLGGVIAAYALLLAGGPVLLGVVALPLLAALPAALMLLTIDDHWLGALNPVAWRELAMRLGGDYVTLLVRVAALALLAAFALVVVAPALPHLLAVPLARVVLLYAFLAGYRGLGEAIFAHREQLDLPPVGGPPPHPAAAEEAAILADAQACVDADDAAGAAALLARRIRGRGAARPVHDRYRALLAQLGDRDGLLQHGREYIAVLLTLKEPRAAMALYRDCLALAPDFALDGPDEWSALLAHADASGQSQLAVALAEGFLARFPRDRDRQATALVAARLMAGRLGREEEARALLDRMLAEAPDHPLAADLVAAKLALGRTI
jgi:hypothetical protein